MLRERLVILRNEKGLSKKEMAKVLKIDQSTYGKYELGKREPDYDTLRNLADFFNVSTDYLLGRSDVRNPHECETVTKAPHTIDTSGLTEEDIAYIDALIAGIKARRSAANLK